jgi:hypothetical protein
MKEARLHVPLKEENLGEFFNNVNLLLDVGPSLATGMGGRGNPGWEAEYN